MKFIKGPDLLERIESLLKTASTDIYVAVAFWGEGASDALGLRSMKQKVRILCNLRLGGTNPCEVERLCKIANVQVRHNDALHAKVYSNGRVCIVGSANASTNGLGWEGAKSRGLIEAAVEFNDTENVGLVNGWIADLWANGTKVKQSDLQLAKKRWESVQNSRAPSTNDTSIQSLQSALVRDPRIFAHRNISLVWHLVEEASKLSMAAAKKKQKAEPRFARFYDYIELPTDPSKHGWPRRRFVVEVFSWEKAPTKRDHWKVDGPVWYLGDWEENPELRDRRRGGYANYWLRRHKNNIPPSVTAGVPIRLDAVDRKFLLSAVNAHANAKPHVKKRRFSLDLDEFLQWCEANYAPTWKAYLNGQAFD